MTWISEQNASKSRNPMNQIAAKLQRPFKQIINESEILNLNQELKNRLKNKCWKLRSKLKIAAPFKQINPFHCFAPSPYFNRVVQMVQLMRIAACKFLDFQRHLMMSSRKLMIMVVINDCLWWYWHLNSRVVLMYGPHDEKSCL